MLTTPELAGLPYYGGKSGAGGQRVGGWIASLLPWAYDQIYIEPFCGMLGVLLQRDRCQTEVANDLNRNVVNWWLAVRDQPEEMAYRLAHTPLSRALFAEYATTLTAAPPIEMAAMPDVERALRWHVIVTQSLHKGDNNPSPGRWELRLTRHIQRWPEARVQPLADRLRRVAFECSDALTILERSADVPNAVVYCDPPYRSTNTSAYHQTAVDWARLADLLQAQRGQAAISGAGDEWDDLGWQRHEQHLPKPVDVLGQQRPRRTEVLWTNFEPSARPEVRQLSFGEPARG